MPFKAAKIYLEMLQGASDENLGHCPCRRRRGRLGFCSHNREDHGAAPRIEYLIRVVRSSHGPHARRQIDNQAGQHSTTHTVNMVGGDSGETVEQDWDRWVLCVTDLKRMRVSARYALGTDPTPTTGWFRDYFLGQGESGSLSKMFSYQAIEQELAHALKDEHILTISHESPHPPRSHSPRLTTQLPT